MAKRSTSIVLDSGAQYRVQWEYTPNSSTITIYDEDKYTQYELLEIEDLLWEIVNDYDGM